MFKTDGIVYRHNLEISGNERPMEERPTVLSSLNITTWCVLSKEFVIGPHFSKHENVTGETYESMLINCTYQQFRSLKNEFIIQQDGPPLHYSNRVKAYFSWKVSSKWLWRG